MRTMVSFNRLSILFKDYWYKAGKTLILLTLVAGGILAVGLIYLEVQFGYYPLKYNKVQSVIFNFGLSVCAILFAITWYHANWSKMNRSFFLGLPVSNMERTLITFLWVQMFFVLWYFLLFTVINNIILPWANNYEFMKYKELVYHQMSPYVPSTRKLLFDFSVFNLLLTVLVVQCLLLTGFLVFRKWAVTKAITVLFILIWVYMIYEKNLNYTWWNPKDWVVSREAMRYLTNADFSEYIQITATGFLHGLLQTKTFIVWLILWVVLFFKIKEMEA